MPLLLYGLASILSVEMPDLEADRLGDKRTWLARQQGRGFGFDVVGAGHPACRLDGHCTGYFLNSRRRLSGYPADSLAGELPGWKGNERSNKDVIYQHSKIMEYVVYFLYVNIRSG
jgi:hypothetical protein